MKLLPALALILALAAPVHAQRGDVDGRVAAAYDVPLAFPVAGVVTKVQVEPGTKVRDQDVLVALDAQAAQLRQTIAELELELAKAELAQQAAQVKSGRSETNLERLQLKVKQAEARLQLAQVMLRRRELRAPRDGTIARILVQPGQYVAAGQPVVRLIQIDPRRIEAAVPTQKAVALKVGDAVRVFGGRRADSDADPESEAGVTATVTYLSPVVNPRTDTRAAHFALPPDTSWPVGSHVAIDLPTPAPASAASPAEAAPAVPDPPANQANPDQEP